MYTLVQCKVNFVSLTIVIPLHPVILHSALLAIYTMTTAVPCRPGVTVDIVYSLLHNDSAQWLCTCDC